MDRVRGEQPLPIATSSLSEATTRARRIPRAARYLALSVQVNDDGSWKVHKITLDTYSKHVITERLDGGESGELTPRELPAVLAYWVGELGPLDG
jgi:hypothetical protein